MRTWLHYFRYLRGKKIIFALGLLCGVMYGIMSGFGLPVIFQTVFRNVFESHGNVWQLWQIVVMACLIPMAFFVRGIFNFLNVCLMNSCGLEILRGLRRDLFAKLQELPMEFFDHNLSGDLVNRLINDTKSLQDTVVQAASELFCQPMQMVAALGGLIYLSCTHHDALFLAVFLCAIPLCLVPIRMIKRRLKAKSRQVQDAEAAMTQDILENLLAVQEVRSFNLEERYREKLSGKMYKLMEVTLQAIQYQRAQQPVMEALGALIVAVVFVYAFYQKIPFSVFSTMGLALYFAFDPIKKTVDTVSKMHRVSGAVDRIEEILNVQSSVKEPLQPVPFTTCEGAIRFQNVSFSYTKNEMALRDITLDIPKNAFCALVGHSGSGKSTFVKLIPRFYDASSGQVSIDGNNVRDIQLRDLRNQIGIVSQHPLLFNDTIFNNILLGNPLATKEMVYEAAQHAFAHDFILEFNKGYETCVGELGNRLSGGQKQRIALARAFLKNAPILLLDEATAALDSQSEHFIQLAMERLTKGKTVVAIAHRLSTIKHADLIVLLDKGSIIGTGQHASLIRESKVYAELVQKQNLH